MQSDIQVTDAALKQIAKIIQETQAERGLRLALEGGGCSGLSYKFKVAEAQEAQDLVIEREGVKLLVDPKSLIYLRGTTIDYQGDIMGANFVFQNPNAKSTCGCGTSFAI